MKNNISGDTIISVSKELIAGDLLDGEVVILNLKDDIYYGLDPIGGRIWNLIQKPIRFVDILQTLIEEYEIEYKQCNEDVLALLEDMLSKNLIEIHDADTI